MNPEMKNETDPDYNWEELQRELNEEIIAAMRERYKQRKSLGEMDLF